MRIFNVVPTGPQSASVRAGNLHIPITWNNPEDKLKQIALAKETLQEHINKQNENRNLKWSR